MAPEVPVLRAPKPGPSGDDPLAINAHLVTEWLTAFLRDEIVLQRGYRKAIVGVSGGVDSSLTAFLCARPPGAETATGV